jgi:predicted nucleotidyltransferase
MIPMNELQSVVSEQPYPLLFATISGAHLYGFPSPDSDFDLRGVHMLSLVELVGQEPGEQTVEVSGTRDGREIDLVTHEARKFFELLLKPNGYVLEQLYSPLVVQTSDAHVELRNIAYGCVTRHHAHHYLGFAHTQWSLFEKQQRVKPLLYLYRVLLTGIHLMCTGVVEANLVTLNEHYRLPQVPELVERKVHGNEQIRLDNGDVAFHEREFTRLTGELERATQVTSLPEMPSARAALNDLLLRLRLEPGRHLPATVIPT